MNNVLTRTTAQKATNTSTSQALGPSGRGVIVEFKIYQLDVQVAFPDGCKGRPFIMVATDLRTGTVLSQSVHCSHVDERDSSELLDRTRWALMKSGKHISDVLVDVGPAFRNQTFAKACRRHAITVRVATPFVMSRTDRYVSSLTRFLSDTGNYHSPDVCTLGDVVHTYADEIYNL